MNKEQLEGKLDQVTGAIKQKAGEALGNQKLANSGVAEQVKGAAKETWGRAKDVACEQTDARKAEAEANKEDLKVRAEEKFDEARDKVVNTAQNIKHSLNDKIDSFREKHSA